MKLQTIIPVSPQSNQIDYNSTILLLGSCFTENIGDQLDYFKFRNLQNPFGVLFHPIAIQRLIRRAVEDVFFTEEDLFCQDGIWHSFEVHSLVNSTSKETMIQLLNEQLSALKTYIQTASHIVLTFGTAWVYRHLTSDMVVANCHKVANKAFSKELLSVEDVSHSVEKIKNAIQKLNEHATVITTISPVRHLKDGFVENTRSKAHLLAGVHGVEELYYFPAFELMMDELRDYRFYKSDLIHPNETAIAIIWERFRHVWVAPKTESLQKEIDVIQKGLRHRPFHPKSEAHQVFQESLQQKIDAVMAQLPDVRFDK